MDGIERNGASFSGTGSDVRFILYSFNGAFLDGDDEL